jgi:hypothetical protein
MVTVDQIKSMLQQLTLFRISLDDFEEWLTAASWNMHKDSKPDAVRMVGQIELLLSEYDGGYRSEKQVFDGLSLIAGVFEMSNAPAMPRVAASSTWHWYRDSPNLKFQLSEASDRQYGSGFSYTPLVQASR